MTEVQIDAERLLGRLNAFAAIGATPNGGVNRQALSEEDRRARRLLAELALARGFSVYQDAIANLFVRREGKDGKFTPAECENYFKDGHDPDQSGRALAEPPR